VRSRFLAVPVALMVLAAGLSTGWVVSRGATDRASFASALDALPATTATVDYTRWSDISGPLDDAGLRGLTTRSVIAVLDTEMVDMLGWSATELAWEAYGRTDGGAITALGLGDVSVQQAKRSFAAIGSAAGTNTWQLNDDADLSIDFVSTFAWVRVVADHELVLAAPDRASLEAATDAVTGRERSLLDVRAVAAVAGRLGTATSVLVQNRQFLCLSSQIPSDDEAGLRQLAAALGPDDQLVDPAWGARGLFEGDPQRIEFAVAFDSDAVARDQTRVRQALTTGPFIGRSGQVADSLRDINSTTADGVVSFASSLMPEGEEFMTDTGPVVFAGCAA